MSARLRGPWVLLNGFIEQAAPDGARVVFTFLRGLLIPESRLQGLRETLERTEYPGNYAIPRPQEDHYTFAGEIPWSVKFGSGLRTQQGKALRNVQPAFERWRQGERGTGLPVEIPVHDFAWESYHSVMNEAGGFETAAPALCEKLHLANRSQRIDLFDATGRHATVYRKIRDGGGRGNLLYIRRSLLRRYLEVTHQKASWIVWGERNFSASSGIHQRADLRAVWSEHRHIHKRFIFAH